MQNPTPLFPGFHLQTLRRKPRSDRQKLAVKINQLKQQSFSQLSECLGQFIPKKIGVRSQLIVILANTVI